MGGFRKINIFWGMKILWIFFGGHHKIGLYLVVISMHFWVFSSRGGGGGTLIFLYIRRLGPFFWGLIFEFQYFFGFSEK